MDLNVNNSIYANNTIIGNNCIIEKNSIIENIFGILATCLITIALMPQVYKAFKTKSTKDLSIKWLLLEGSANLNWTIYGVLKKDILIIISSLAMCTSQVLLIIAKYKYKPIIVNIK
jgi:MtN3 and saliva related transmembrane protein|tara:strand:+ start:267 stop:617 length:351 start_codon:yes stop_codon:yes gene_type:complete